jgi:hypothetical protein
MTKTWPPLTYITERSVEIYAGLDLDGQNQYIQAYERRRRSLMALLEEAQRIHQEFEDELTRLEGCPEE